MTDLHDEVLQAQYAQEVLNNPAYKQAWQDITAGITTVMASSPMGDEKTHNKLVIALQIANKLQKTLENALTTGKMADIQLEEQGKFRKLMNRF